MQPQNSMYAFTKKPAYKSLYIKMCSYAFAALHLNR